MGLGVFRFTNDKIIGQNYNQLPNRKLISLKKYKVFSKAGKLKFKFLGITTKDKKALIHILHIITVYSLIPEYNYSNKIQ